MYLRNKEHYCVSYILYVGNANIGLVKPGLPELDQHTNQTVMFYYEKGLIVLVILQTERMKQLKYVRVTKQVLIEYLIVFFFKFIEFKGFVQHLETFLSKSRVSVRSYVSWEHFNVLLFIHLKQPEYLTVN